MKTERHHCHAVGCDARCAPERLCCPSHWFLVPKLLRDAVWASYRPGQCDDKQPSKAWHSAADAAIGAIAKLEGQPITRAMYDALIHFGFETLAKS